MPDHAHVFDRHEGGHGALRPVGDIKTGSTNHINENRWVAGGSPGRKVLAAFSYSHSQLPVVVRYIQNQNAITRENRFAEYLQMLEKFDVPHDERYIFKPVDND